MTAVKSPADNIPPRKKPFSDWKLSLNMESLLGDVEKDSSSTWVVDCNTHISPKGGKRVGRRGLCPLVVASGDKAGGGQNWCGSSDGLHKVHPARLGCAPARLIGFLPGLSSCRGNVGKLTGCLANL